MKNGGSTTRGGDVEMKEHESNGTKKATTETAEERMARGNQRGIEGCNMTRDWRGIGRDCTVPQEKMMSVPCPSVAMID